MYLRICANAGACLLLVPFALMPVHARNSQRIAGIAISKEDTVYVWWKDGVVTTGSSEHFESKSHARPYRLPAGETPNDIVAISISASDNRVHAWYRDNKTSVGTATDLSAHIPPQPFALPAGQTIGAIVGMGIDHDDRVYTWYDNKTFTIGRATRLDSIRSPQAYTLPAGKTTSEILEMDIAKTNDQVYAWYRDGSASEGVPAHLESTRPSFAYIPSQVLTSWWAPNGQPNAPDIAGLSAVHPVGPNDPETDSPVNPKPLPGGAGAPPPEPAGSPVSPPFTTAFQPPLGAPDLMIAAGKQYLVVSNSSYIAFFDKNGQALKDNAGKAILFRTDDFFSGFVSKHSADGSWNENNINLYMNLGKPCDSPDFPELSTGDRFCIGSFYDTRVSYDSTSGRFFVVSNSRHALWNNDCRSGDGTHCGCYQLPYSQVSNPAICVNGDAMKSGKCDISSNQYCGLARRYAAFAVSKSEDPRDGFYQYLITENNPRDWPWQGTNGNHFVVAYNGKGPAESPVATVFSVAAVKDGVQHPPYFRYYSADVGGVKAVRPVSQYESQAGLTLLVGFGADNRIDIFGLPQSIDPWTAPPLQKTTVTFQSAPPNLFGAVYRRNLLYFVGSVEAGSKTSPDLTRYSVRILRVPVTRVSGSAIQASTDPAKGFLDSTFGGNTSTDPPNSRLSYETPAIAVNHSGDMLIGYGRRPYESQPPLRPEARYSMWYAQEKQIRRSTLLRAGAADDPGGGLDYATAVVDPDDTSFWVALPYVDSSQAYMMAIGRILP